MMAGNNVNRTRKSVLHPISPSQSPKTTDLLNTPKCLKTGGTDAIFNLKNSNQKVDVIEYGLKQEQFNRLQNYFIRYGYKVSEYGMVNYRTRKYFNGKTF